LWNRVRNIIVLTSNTTNLWPFLLFSRFPRFQRFSGHTTSSNLQLTHQVSNQYQTAEHAALRYLLMANSKMLHGLADTGKQSVYSIYQLSAMGWFWFTSLLIIAVLDHEAVITNATVTARPDVHAGLADTTGTSQWRWHHSCSR